MDTDLRIGARDLTRRFGDVVANDAVDLAVARGTIHALVGENGAGKTTLMRMLYGLDQPDSGSVLVDDAPVRLSGPADATRRGIGMVHQEFKVAPDLTLLENLILGREPVRRGRLDRTAARARAEALETGAGVALDWDRRAAEASVATLQRLEILRLLHWEADVLILDEPTAVLAPPQVADLLALLGRLRDGGRTVVFISHKLQEVLDIAESVTVMRGGRTVGTVAAAAADPDRLVRMMVGDSVPVVKVTGESHAGRPLLELRAVGVRDRTGRDRLRDVSLTVAEREVVGVAGVAGNGQDELVECVVGLRRPGTGSVVFAGDDVTGDDVAARLGRGIGYIPADRRRDGLSLSSSLRDNAIAGAQRSEALSRRSWFRPGAATRWARRIVEAYRVRAGSLDAPAASLSGGNQQRLILGRSVARDPAVLVAAQPTRGVDVRGAGYIREQLLALRERGSGVLLISEELDELVALSDRIIVLAGGAIAGEVQRPISDLTELGRLMTARTGA